MVCLLPIRALGVADGGCYWVVLICTIPLLASFFPLTSTIRTTLASSLSTAFCFSNLFFLGLAQRDVGRTSPSPRLHSALLLLLVLSLLLTFPLLPLILPSLSDSAALLPVILVITILLAMSTAYLQSAVFALAALWSTSGVLGVMSGQGGIAVLVSLAQVLLAVISAFHSSDPVEGERGGESKLAGVGLWGLGAVGAFGCMLAHRYLVRHEDYGRVSRAITSRRTEANGRKERRTKRLLKTNWEVNLAVAWVFVVTLVSRSKVVAIKALMVLQAVFPPITTAIVSVRENPPVLLQPAVFIPLHFLLFNGKPSFPQWRAAAIS
jgi:solute carrier family 29 (equilibrative nucleoside transporter), member 1/2/3